MNKTNETGLQFSLSAEKGSRVNDEFWAYLDQERKFLLNHLYRNNSDLSREDCEDILGEFAEFYARQAYKRGTCARRFDQLHRRNLLSRVEWKKKDFITRRNAQRRGNGVCHASIDDDCFFEHLSVSCLCPCGSGFFETIEVLLSALVEASRICKDKQLMVVEALLCWIEEGCPTVSWYEKLTPQAIEEFLALKKGRSLEGKVSATFTKVKKTLREIIVREGLLEN